VVASLSPYEVLPLFPRGVELAQFEAISRLDMIVLVSTNAAPSRAMSCGPLVIKERGQWPSPKDRAQWQRRGDS
jgi:hypothetical protein